MGLKEVIAGQKKIRQQIEFISFTWPQHCIQFVANFLEIFAFSYLGHRNTEGGKGSLINLDKINTGLTLFY